MHILQASNLLYSRCETNLWAPGLQNQEKSAMTMLEYGLKGKDLKTHAVFATWPMLFCVVVKNVSKQESGRQTQSLEG